MVPDTTSSAPVLGLVKTVPPVLSATSVPMPESVPFISNDAPRECTLAELRLCCKVLHVAPVWDTWLSATLSELRPLVTLKAAVPKLLFPVLDALVRESQSWAEVAST